MPVGSFSVTGLTSLINSLLPEPHAGLLSGILFGTRASLSRELVDDLIRTGTLHVIALSGMNITVVVGLVTRALTWLFSRRISSLLSIAAVCWYALFVGFSPSVTRAAIMGSLSLLAVIFGRRNWAFLCWTLTVASMLLLNIGWLFDVSFQLSVLATLGIILFCGDGTAGMTVFGDARRPQYIGSSTPQSSLSEAPPIAGKKTSGIHQGRGFSAPQNAYPRRLEWVRNLPVYDFAVPLSLFWSFIRDDLRLTLSAQVFTIPLILFHFHRVSLVSPIANLLIGWIMAPLMLLGWATAILGMVVPPAGQVVAWVDWVFLEYVIQIVMVLSRVPGASIGR